MDSRPRIKKEALGPEGLKQVFSELSPNETYEIFFDFNKADPRSQKAVYIVDTNQQPSLVGTINLLGRPAIGPAKDIPVAYLLRQANLQNVGASEQEKFISEHFFDVSRIQLRQKNTGFLGYVANMEPPEPSSRESAFKSLGRFMDNLVSAPERSVKPHQGR